MAKTMAPTRRKPRGTNRPTEVLRRDMLDAAVKIFARDGYDGASLLDIATLADTRHPLIIYHFESKEGLWRQVMMRIFDDLKANYSAVTDLSRDLSGLDSLKMFIRVFVQFCAKYPERLTLILGDMHSESDRLEWLTTEYMVGLHKQLNAMFDRVAAEGRLKPIPRHHLTHMLIGSASTFFVAGPMIRRVYGVEVQSAEVVSAHADWVIEMLLGGLILPETA